ncbi:hypothetical protein V492_07048 [Pseudogymnoascus sp. VKM F-4246]|nr:hypothetical protein V492_07048 [Pseudogymnoascus sp. VKM F-4246]
MLIIPDSVHSDDDNDGYYQVSHSCSLLLPPFSMANSLAFLAFPGEIRNRIYALLLVVPPPSTTTSVVETPPIHPEVLRVSRQIYYEALPFLYAYNTFIAHPVRLYRFPQLRRWIDPVLAPSLIGLIRRYHVFVRLECDAGFSAEEARDAFSGVDELTVEVFQSQFKGSGNGVLRLFEGVRGVRKARVFGSITEWPEYVAWLERRMMSSEGSDLLESRGWKDMVGFETFPHMLESVQVAA